MTLLIKSSELAGPPEGRRFVGAEHGDVPVSLFLVEAGPGSGPELHRHPYPEVFVLANGRAEFEVGGARLVAGAGDIVIAPAGAPHRFTSIGTDRLQLTAIHTASEMETDWLSTSLASARGACRRSSTDKEGSCSPPSDTPLQE